ncbi:MAG: hypothetical protein RR854_00020 [Muribaculaceae bacterium]
MKAIDENIIKASESVLKKDITGVKSIFCSTVLRLMDTEEYGNNYCESIELVLDIFPEIEKEKLEK